MEPLITVVTLYHEVTIPRLVTQAKLGAIVTAQMIAESLGKDLCFVMQFGRVLSLQDLACHGSLWTQMINV